MPRKMQTPGQPLDYVLKVRLTTPEGNEVVDLLEGDETRSDFARTAIRERIANLTGNSSTSRNFTTSEESTHRHKPGDFISERTVKGVTTKTYRCTDCPKEIERRG